MSNETPENDNLAKYDQFVADFTADLPEELPDISDSRENFAKRVLDVLNQLVVDQTTIEETDDRTIDLIRAAQKIRHADQKSELETLVAMKLAETRAYIRELAPGEGFPSWDKVRRSPRGADRSSISEPSYQPTPDGISVIQDMRQQVGLPSIDEQVSLDIQARAESEGAFVDFLWGQFDEMKAQGADSGESV